MAKTRNEVILIRSHGGKLAEIKIVTGDQKQGNTRFATDLLVTGSMDTKPLPAQLNALIELVASAGRLKDLEQLVKTILE